MSNWKIIVADAVAVMAMTAIVAGQSANPQAGASKKASKDASNQVHHIAMPQYPGAIMQGPNLEVYQKDCLICHTGRYVSMQPRFSKAVWQSEVTKMVDAYGAPISDADQALIVEYLVAVKGVEAPVPTAATPK